MANQVISGFTSINRAGADMGREETASKCRAGIVPKLKKDLREKTRAKVYKYELPYEQPPVVYLGIVYPTLPP